MKIVTWNSQWSLGQDGRVDVARLVGDARRWTDFDVLCLQEVTVGYDLLAGNPGHDQVALLASLLPGYETHFAPAVDERGEDGRWRQFGNLIASRLPVHQVRALALPCPAQPGRVSMPRVCLVATLSAPFGPLRVMTTHLEYYAPRQRMAQVHALRAAHAEACELAANPPAAGERGGAFAQRLHTADTVLCGDFNYEPASAEHALMQAPNAAPRWPHDEADGEAPGVPRLLDAWTLAHPGRAHDPTFQWHDRRYQPDPATIDFIYVSETLAPRVRDVRVNLDTQASDHQPVCLELN